MQEIFFFGEKKEKEKKLPPTNTKVAAFHWGWVFLFWLLFAFYN